MFVESESKKVGDLRVPEALIERMRAAPCVWLELRARRARRPADRGLRLLRHATSTPSAPASTRCASLRGNEVVNAWQEAARAGRTAEVVRDLLVAALRPDLPRVDAAQLRRRSARPARALRWDGSEAALREARAQRHCHRGDCNATAPDRSGAVAARRSANQSVLRRRLAMKPIAPRPASNSA